MINITRQANGELPGVTTAGSPEGDECVPRKVASGACGSLWDALMYEKNLEMTGIEGAVSWWDARSVEERCIGGFVLALLGWCDFGDSDGAGTG